MHLRHFIQVAPSATLFKSIWKEEKNAVSFSSALRIVHLPGITWYPEEKKWSLLPVGCIIWLEGCSLPVLLAAKADEWSFHPLVTANDSGQRNRCEEQHPPKRGVWSVVNLSMGPSLHVWPHWQAGEWMKDSSHMPELMADTPTITNAPQGYFVFGGLL